MALFPKIQSPCPYKNNLAAVMDGDMCRMCKRQVFDLTDMSDGARVAFLEGCTGEVCVSYRQRVRPALAAAAIAAAALVAPVAAAACETTDTEWVTVGGIKDTSKIEYVQDPADAKIPELPVVYENKPPPPAAKEPVRHAATGAINSPS